MLDYSRAIFENSRDAIIVHRKDTTILDANQAACDLLGYKLEDLIGSLTTGCRNDLYDQSTCLKGAGA